MKSDSVDIALIRETVAQTCTKFDDAYWSAAERLFG